MIVRKNIDADRFTRGGDPYKKMGIGSHHRDFKVDDRVYIKPNGLAVYRRRLGRPSGTGYTYQERVWQGVVSHTQKLGKSLRIVRVYPGSLRLAWAPNKELVEVPKFMISHLKDDDSMPDSKNKKIEIYRDRMNSFLSYHDFINESESADEGYGCIMLLADVPDWPRLVRRLVREEDVYTSADDDYGYEEKPHITLMYGIHDGEIIDKSIIYSKIEGISTMRFAVNEVSIFQDDDKPYEVVKFDIKPSKALLDIRKSLEDDLPNTQTFPDYHPHMTIAYVKKGEGSKYRRIFKKALRFVFNLGVYSMPDYRKVYIDLKKKEYKK